MITQLLIQSKKFIILLNQLPLSVKYVVNIAIIVPIIAGIRTTNIIFINITIKVEPAVFILNHFNVNLRLYSIVQ